MERNSLWEEEIRELQKRTEKELDAYYDNADPGTEKLLNMLDHMMETRSFAFSYEKKAAMHELLCRECEIHLFRELPFFFEMSSGRKRYTWGGLQSDVGMYFQNRDKDAWRVPYLEAAQKEREKGFFYGWSPVGLDHHVPGYDRLLQKGLNGIIKEAEQQLAECADERQKSFYNSVIQSNRALIGLAERFAREAQQLASGISDEKSKKHYERIAAAAQRVPANPPETFYEAMCLILFYRECVGSIEGIGISTLGHLDRLLYPYYRQDLVAGRINAQEAMTLICQLLLYTQIRFGYHLGQFHETSTTIEIGGCDCKGNIIWNDITEMILDAVLCIRSNATKINCRVSRDHPKEFLNKIAQVQLAKIPTVMLHNDEVLIPARVRQGQAVEDARLYVGCGCHEIVLAGTEVCTRADSWVNLPRILLQTLEDCVEEASCESYDEFYKRFLTDLRAYHEKIAAMKNRWEACWCQYDPLILYSSSLDGCLEQGKDLTEGGAKYNTTMLSMLGTATLIDSLYVIRQLVFAEKRMSLSELQKVLQENFEGHDELRQYIVHRLPKHGTNDPLLNVFSAEVLEAVSQVSGQQNARGGRYMPAFYPHNLFTMMGEMTGATPDGRLANVPLSRGFSPSEFIPTDSALDVIHSLKTVDFTAYADSFCTEITLPVLLAGETGRQILTSVMEAFLDAEGSSLQFNLLEKEELLDAQKHPEAHSGLMVRVCGFSAAFTALETGMQNEIIERAIR